MNIPDEYELALTHIAYEYAALESAYNLAFAGSGPSLVVAYDSFLVHYRSLVEFFHATKDWRRRFPDDLRAEDYVAAWATPKLLAWPKWKDDMHILLAHLSTKRNRIHDQKTGLNHTVDFEPMRKEIRDAWKEFEDGLGSTIHKGKLDSLLNARRRDFGLTG